MNQSGAGRESGFPRYRMVHSYGFAFESEPFFRYLYLPKTAVYPIISPMTHSKRIASRLQLKQKDVTAVITLLDDGNTLPFIARYRKEATGGMDEEQIRQIQAENGRLQAIDARRETILNAIKEQGQLTAALARALHAADSLTTLEDLYQPYKRKRATRASKARERGLQPLADHILAQTLTPKSAKTIARPFVTDEVPTVDDALSGARDIVAETISDNAAVRQRVREKALKFAELRVIKIKNADDPKQVYRLYYEYGQRVNRLKPYQVLAVNRGEAAKVLRVHVDIAERDWRRGIEAAFRADRRSPLAGELQTAVDEAAKRLLLPAIERDVRRHLSEQAETHAIAVFAKNMRGLLSQPPLADQVVLGIDPGFRSGSKAAVIDATGKVLATATIYPHPPQKRWDGALAQLTQFIERFGVTLIAIGNGTASRETEQLAATLTRKMEAVQYAIVNEAGASVYSASPLARQELPGMDVSLRGAVSIARRIQDPLAELVKIDPKAIGVGLYQHDVNQKQLSAALAGVVETAVNQVGVDVNTASPALLTHVAGIGATVAAAMGGLWGWKRPFSQSSIAAGGARAGQKGVRAGGGLSARARWRSAAGWQCDSSGKLWGNNGRFAPSQHQHQRPNGRESDRHQGNDGANQRPRSRRRARLRRADAARYSGANRPSRPRSACGIAAAAVTH